MGHQIATSVCWNEPFAYWTLGPGQPPGPVALFVTSLDANGNLNLYQQLPGGIWSTFPPPLASTAFASVLGISNFIIALGVDNFLYISVFAQGSWGPFVQVLQPLLSGDQNSPQPICDFSAIEFARNVMITSVVDNTVGQNDVNIGLYSCCLNYSGGNFADIVGAATWNTVFETPDGVTSFGPAIPALGVGWYSSGTLTPTVSLVAIQPDSVYSVVASYNNNGNYSVADPLFFPFEVGYPDPLYSYRGQSATAILLTMGANNTLQLIILINGQPWLFYSSDGINWQQFENLLPNGVFYKVAAGVGNSSNLQVVILGDLGSGWLPYLLWQDSSNSSWNVFQQDTRNNTVGALNNPLSGAIRAVDLAIGAGWSETGSALQVAYLGSDHNVYLSWQDNEGNWNTYAGKTGNGLP
jgi:hypothetical protein